MGSGGNGNTGGKAQELPVSMKIALEKAKEYKKNMGVVGDSRSEAFPGIFWESVEIEIYLSIRFLLEFFPSIFCSVSFPQRKQ